MDDNIPGSELPRARTTASAMESADSDELGVGAELTGTAPALEDSEETTPAAKLLLVERGRGMFQPTTINANNKTLEQPTRR